MKKLVLRALAVPFLLAAAYIYIHVHFLAPEPVHCDAFSFFSSLDLGCWITSATWVVVCVLGAPGVILWSLSAKKAQSAE